MPDNPALAADSRALAEALAACLEDNKGRDVTRLEVSKLTTVTDFMIIVTGASSRHVKALTANTLDAMRARGVRALGVEGEQGGEWVLIDYDGVIVHVMRAETRAFYDLESLWRGDLNPDRRRRAGVEP